MTEPTVAKYRRRKLQRKTTPKKHKENTNYTYAHTYIHTHTQNSIQIKHTQINTASPLVYNYMGAPRGRLPQRAGLPGLNGGGAAAAVQ